MATCILSFVDLDGVRHSAEVSGEGLYDAALLGMAAFKKHDLELHRKSLTQLLHPRAGTRVVSRF